MYIFLLTCVCVYIYICIPVYTNMVSRVQSPGTSTLNPTKPLARFVEAVETGPHSRCEAECGALSWDSRKASPVTCMGLWYKLEGIASGYVSRWF